MSNIERKQKESVITAVSLFSGGLDSQLSVYLMREQGVFVVGITFESPFFKADKARTAAAALEMPLHVEDFTKTIAGLIENPAHGFGKAVNPCIDCHASMIRLAGQWMESKKFHFLITGEVLFQRPLSQNRNALDIVAAESGYDGMIVRPLSGGLLPETVPEQNGWIRREKLGRISGRSRAPQKKLAAKFGLESYPQPAGGCRLTETGFAAKVRDLKEHGELQDISMLNLLVVGRHFRVGPLKIIVGRDQAENEILADYKGNGFMFISHESTPGPAALVCATPDEEQLSVAAGICAAYGDYLPDAVATLVVDDGNARRFLSVMPADRGTVEKHRLPRISHRTS